MKFLLLALTAAAVLSGCGLTDMPSKMDKTNDNMGKMIEGMAHTNKGIDKQSQLIPFENMLKAENIENLTPIPTRLIPFGKELAEVVSAQQLAEIAHLWLKEVNEGLPEKKHDSNGNDIDFTPDEIAKINHVKKGYIVGLQILAGFLPAEQVAELIQQQVYAGGAYEDDVYALLMLRAMFLQDIMLQGDWLSAPLSNVGKIEKAVQYNSSIDQIAKLSFVKRVRVKTTGLIPDSENLVATFDKSLARKNWMTIYAAAQADCKVTEREDLSGNPALDEQNFRLRVSSYQNSMTKIETYLKSWNPQP